MRISQDFLDSILHDLPIIRPVREFVHLNLLMSYQNLNFWKANYQVGINLDAHPLPSLKKYQDLLNNKIIDIKNLEKELNQFTHSKLKSEVLGVLKSEMSDFLYTDIRTGALHAQWNEHIQVNIVSLADGLLLKWLSMFLDQGISKWPMPGACQDSFYHCLKLLLESSMIKPHPFTRQNFNKFFLENSEAVIYEHLNFLCPESHKQQDYIKESLLTLRGWAGLVYAIQKEPELLSIKRKITLMDFLAVKLILERAWIESELGQHKPLTKFEEKSFITKHIFDNEYYFQALKVAQIALEETIYLKMIKILSRKINQENLVEKKYQIIFCMDDREANLRKYLEESSECIETFSTAGHFGIEAMYQNPLSKFYLKHCPPPVIPKVMLHDRWKKVRRKNPRTPSNFYLKNALRSQWSEVKTNVFLFLKLFTWKSYVGRTVKNVKQVHLPYTLQMTRMESDSMDKTTGLPIGFTVSEMVKIAFNQLQILGLYKNFSPMVIFVGHGGTSENNPYFNAYGCGACSGRPGGMNARAIATILNNMEVRKDLLEKYKINIPTETIFLASFHDTTRDSVDFFMDEKLSHEQILLLNRIKKYFSLALHKNAKNRCRKFSLVKYPRSGLEAQRETFRRSQSFFETRPELGHTDVTFAIVGRRKITKGLYFDRASFVQSYDPTIDDDGKILTQILSAVVPVCSGINLDYFFSRSDNIRFGAGSKLPQNVFGNIGLSHGTESDLLFGLPVQMVDQHLPTRLLIIVEQKPEIVLSAAKNIGKAFEIIENEWSFLMSLDPVSQKWFRYQNGIMQELNHD